MNTSDCLSTISKITDCIYLSGIHPFNNFNKLNHLNITHILCCVDKKYTEDTHDKIYTQNSNIVILYLPLLDSLEQNLWCESSNNIDITYFPLTEQKIIEKNKLQNIYQNKPLIEIGYHFINNAVINSNSILIHCMAGISRSVSILSYYFMKKYSLNLYDSLNYIKIKRIIAQPNNYFITQLKNYEKQRELYNIFSINSKLLKN